ncbi:MAG: histone deacetylase family protein, partial [Actinomycetota bacterium]
APDPSRERLELVHEPGYLDRLERFCASGGGWVDPDTYAGPRSYEAAARAAAACCGAVDGVFEEAAPAFCLIRPPGHHATLNRAMGFCLINHAAVAARHAVARGLAEKAAIVDVDVHHGNGTQEVFWRDPSVLYLSLHQFPWYPGTGALEEVGEETVNVPLPAGTGDPTYLEAMTRIVGPVLRQFGPGLIIVSAGFDAHARDPLSLMNVSTAGFAAMISSLLALAEEVCGGRLVATLEGGYDLEGLSTSFVAALSVMAGREWEQPPPYDSPEGSVAALERAVEFHSRRSRLS